MIVLGFDTATSATAVGLLPGDGRALEARDDPPQGARPAHMERLLPLARELLERAGLPWAAIERIAVGVGPGTFTGLRIGVATARALGQSLGVPVAGVSSLQALAVAAEPHAEGSCVLTAIDARRGEVFAAVWRGTEALSEPEALAPEALAALVDAAAAPAGCRSWLGGGDGAIRFQAHLQAAGVVVPASGAEMHRVSAATICRLGEHVPPLAPEAVLPDYRRRPDAEITTKLPGTSRNK